MPCLQCLLSISYDFTLNCYSVSRLLDPQFCPKKIYHSSELTIKAASEQKGIFGRLKQRLTRTPWEVTSNECCGNPKQFNNSSTTANADKTLFSRAFAISLLLSFHQDFVYDLKTGFWIWQRSYGSTTTLMLDKIGSMIGDFTRFTFIKVLDWLYQKKSSNKLTFHYSYYRNRSRPDSHSKFRDTSGHLCVTSSAAAQHLIQNKSRVTRDKLKISGENSKSLMDDPLEEMDSVQRETHLDINKVSN